MSNIAHLAARKPLHLPSSIRGSGYGRKLYETINSELDALHVGRQYAERERIPGAAGAFEYAIAAITAAVTAFEKRAARQREEFYPELWADNRQQITAALKVIDANLAKARTVVAESEEAAMKFPTGWQGGSSESFETHQLRVTLERQEVRAELRAMGADGARATLLNDVVSDRFSRIAAVVADPNETLASLLGRQFIDDLRRRVVERRAPHGEAHRLAHYLGIVSARLRDAAAAGTERPMVLGSEVGR